jgi:hypothetical protein
MVAHVNPKDSTTRQLQLVGVWMVLSVLWEVKAKDWNQQPTISPWMSGTSLERSPLRNTLASL